MTLTCLCLAVAVGAAPAATKPIRVFIDAGHAAPENDGNHGAFCQLEKDHTAAVARALFEALPSLGHFEVKLSREGFERPTYQARLHAAEGWKADVIISIHSDARGYSWPWKPFEAEPNTICYRNGLEPGFAVLWNDGGSAKIVEQRTLLGREVITAMQLQGFEPYDGRNYGGLYRADVVPGGWVDIRPDGKNVFFLRGSKTIPTVIIETHHALDVAEVTAWNDEKTVARFANAVADALTARFSPRAPP